MLHRLLPVALLAACGTQEIARPNPPPSPPTAELWPLGGLIYYNTPLPDDHHSKQPKNSDGSIARPEADPSPAEAPVEEEAAAEAPAAEATEDPAPTGGDDAPPDEETAPPGEEEDTTTPDAPEDEE